MVKAYSSSLASLGWGLTDSGGLEAPHTSEAHILGGIFRWGRHVGLS